MPSIAMRERSTGCRVTASWPSSGHHWRTKTTRCAPRTRPWRCKGGVRAACDADIAIRVGLHAGEVLVRAIHNDLSVDYDAIGPTVHLAARMEQMASPGAIYCTANVMRMAEGFVDAQPLGRVPVKGLQQPIDLFQIVGHTSARTRWEVTAARGLTQFVG